jgi:hypothetical protein
MATVIDRPQIQLSAVDVTKQAFDSVKARFADMKSDASQLSGVFAGIAAGLTTGAFAVAVKNVSNYGEALAKSSEKTGLAVESYAKLQYAAHLADVGNEALAKGLKALAGNVYDNDKAFSALGISTRNSSGQIRSMEDIIGDVAEIFSGMEDGAGKSALAVRLLGKAGADLIPLLNRGRQGIREAGDEAQRFGLVMGPEIARRMQEFNDNLKRMDAAAQGAKIAIGSDLIPEINKLLETYLKFNTAGGVFSNLFLSGDDLNNAGARITGIDQKLVALKETRDALTITPGDSGFKAARNFVNTLISPEDILITNKQILLLEQERAALVKVQNLKLSQESLASVHRGPKKAAPEPRKEGGDGKDKGITFDELLARNALTRMKAIEQAEVDADKAAQDWQKTLDGLIGGTVIERTNKMQLSADFLREAFDAGRISSELYGQALDKLLGSTGELSEDMRRAGGAADQLISETSIERAKLMQDTIAELNRRLTAGVISIEQHGEAIKMLAERNKKTTDEITEFWKSAAHSMQESMSTLFFDVMQGNLSDLGNSFKRTIDRMVADVLAAQAATALFGKDFGKGGDIGGLFGKGLSWFGIGGGGGAASSALIGQFAGGTDFVPRTGPYLLHIGEKVTSTAENRGGGMTNTFNFTISGQINRSTQAQIAAETGQAVRRALARNT